MTPTLGIIGALEKEVRQIYHEIEHGTVAEEAGLTIMGGEYHGFNLVATTAGRCSIPGPPSSGAPRARSPRSRSGP